MDTMEDPRDPLNSFYYGLHDPGIIHTLLTRGQADLVTPSGPLLLPRGVGTTGTGTVPRPIVRWGSVVRLYHVGRLGTTANRSVPVGDPPFVGFLRPQGV